MSELNLRALVREVMNTSTLRDPSSLADEVAKRIPQEHAADALRQCLRLMVRQVMSEERPHSTPGTPGGIGSPVSSSRSSKVSAIRDGWQKHLRSRWHVGEGEYQFLGDCTHEDLTFISSDLDKQAEQNQAKARGMRALASALTEHNVKCVKQLPAELLMNSLGAAA